MGEASKLPGRETNGFSMPYYPLLKQGGFVLPSSPREELGCDIPLRGIGWQMSLRRWNDTLCQVTHRATYAQVQRCPFIHLLGGISAMHHPESDGCISKHLHWIAAVWAGFWGLPQHVLLFSSIWRCLSRKDGIPTTVTGAAGSYKAWNPMADLNYIFALNLTVPKV